MDDKEYWEWRHKAAGALRHRLDELRALKVHIKDLRRAPARPEGSVSAVPIVNALVLAYRAGQADDVEKLLAQLAVSWTVRYVAAVPA